MSEQPYTAGFRLTYEEWRDDAIANPDSYGLTPAEVEHLIKERDGH